MYSLVEYLTYFISLGYISYYRYEIPNTAHLKNQTLTLSDNGITSNSFKYSHPLY